MLHIYRHIINVCFLHSDYRSTRSLYLHSLWCEVSYYIDALGWLFPHAPLCEVIFYSGMQRHNISPFLSNRLPQVPLKTPHSICLFYWTSCFYNIKKKTLSQSIATNNRKVLNYLYLWTLWCCSNVLACVEYLHSGPKAQMVFLWCNPAQWLVKQTYSFQSFSSKDWFDFAETKPLPVSATLLISHPQMVQYFSAALSVKRQWQPLL